MKYVKCRRLIIILISLSLVSGCGQFLNNLRRDLDDPDAAVAMDDNEIPSASGPFSSGSPDRGPASDFAKNNPTEGGNWAERGYLSRSPASPSQAYDEEPSRDMSGSISSANAATYMPPSKRLYKNGSRATRDDFIDQSQEEGSLWASSGQTNYYFTRNKVRSPGDLVSLVIENDLYRDIGTEIKRTLSSKEKQVEIAAVQEQFRSKFFSDLEAKNKDKVTTSAAAPERAPASTPSSPSTETSQAEAQSSPSPAPSATPATGASTGTTAATASVGAAMSPEELEQLQRMVPKASLTDVDIYPAIELKAGETMMGEILERYPNGNFKIRTVKRIQYKKGPPRLVSVVGIVKGSDIAEGTDVVNSGKLYEYRVEVSH